MKKFILIIFLFLSSIDNLSAQCEEPSFENTGKTIATKNFEINQQTSQNEIILSFEAATQNASWGRKGSESAVLTIFIDGKYNQDLILFAGKEKFTYQIILGKIAHGKHKISLLLNKERSAPYIGETKIYSLNIKHNTPASFGDKLAISNAPILYARPDTIDKFSDIPLLTYYEILKDQRDSFKIRYTTIFTNEDGGTQTTALMARWGRATDIEWVYEIEINNNSIQAEIYQGANHVTKKFSGRRELGNHPLFFDATVNNNFSDTGCSQLRTVLMPIRVDLSKKSREVVMDENPWTYRIMTEELSREGRINPDKLNENTIADLRDYVFTEVYGELNNAAISLEARTSDGKVFSSDGGNKFLRVDRSGFSRIALRLPRNVRNNSPLLFSITCHQKNSLTETANCRNLKLIKLVSLNKEFFPRQFKVSGNPHEIKANEKAEFVVKFK